jgi:hypothetical protein
MDITALVAETSARPLLTLFHNYSIHICLTLPYICGS